MKLVLSLIQFSQHNTVIRECGEKPFEQQTKPAVLDTSFLQMQSCLSGVILWKTQPTTTEMWTMFDYTAIHLPFYTTSSPQNLFSSHCCASSVLYTRWRSSSPILAVLLICVSLLLLHPVFLDLLPSFSSYHILCSIHIINPSLYIFYSFIYLLHWPFAPLPMPVSVWVLCQPLCQDRSPATPASGGTERETGRAHCRCWTGVVLQRGYTLIQNDTKSYDEHTASYGRPEA